MALMSAVLGQEAFDCFLQMAKTFNQIMKSEKYPWI